MEVERGSFSGVRLTVLQHLNNFADCIVCRFIFLYRRVEHKIWKIIQANFNLRKFIFIQSFDMLKYIFETKKNWNYYQLFFQYIPSLKCIFCITNCKENPKPNRNEIVTHLHSLHVQFTSWIHYWAHQERTNREKK